MEARQAELDTVIDFIRDFTGVTTLQPDDELLDSGVLSSIEMVNVLSFLRKKYDLVMDNSEIVPENFATPRRIAVFVHSRRHAAAS